MGRGIQHSFLFRVGTFKLAASRSCMGCFFANTASGQLSDMLDVSDNKMQTYSGDHEQDELISEWIEV